MYNSLIVRNSYLAEVQITQTPSDGLRIYFQDIPQLRNVHVIGVELFCRDGLSYSPNGNQLVTSLVGVGLTLAVDSTEKFYQWPARSLEASRNGGLIREFARVPINLPKSYITLFDSAGISQNESVCANFYYLHKANA